MTPTETAKQAISKLAWLAQSKEAEAHLLGNWIMSPEMIDAYPIAAEKFAYPPHRDIARIIIELWGNGEPIDAVKVAQCCAAQGKSHLTALSVELFGTASLGGRASAKYYSELVEFYWQKRRFFEAYGEILEPMDTVHDAKALEQAIDRLETDLLALQGPTRTSTFHDAHEAMSGTLDAFSERMSRHRNVVRTGFSRIDNACLGLAPGSMNVLCARPSVGKTALAMQIAILNALRYQIPVGIFELEMSKDDILLRAATHLSRVNWKEVQNGTASHDEKARFFASHQLIPPGLLIIDDTPGLTLSDLSARARRMKREYGIGLIVIDYLQLLVAKGKDIYERATTTSNTVKNLLRSLNIPGLVLAQLNRDVEKRAGAASSDPAQRKSRMRPIMADLRDSGAVEQDADEIWALWADLGPHEPSRYISSLKGRNTGGFRDIECLFDFDTQSILPSDDQQDDMV